MSSVPSKQLLETVSMQLRALAAARALYSDRVAPNYNVFDFFHPNELKLSRILAWLLDPQGSHAQGSSFLEAYTRRLGLDWDHLDLGLARTSIEAPAGGRRRIDVLVRGGGLALAIENKPFDAPDQENQVADYLTFLDSADYKCLVYLTGDEGRGPTTSSISQKHYDRRVAADELKMMSYSDLRQWLDSCRAVCQADRVRAFIDDFDRYILREFEGMADLTEQQQVVAAITATPNSIEAAAKIAVSWEAARSDLLASLARQIATQAPGSWNAEGRLGPKGDVLHIRSAELSGVSFAVSFDAVRHRDFVYGVVSKRPRGEAELAQRVLRTAFGPGDGDGIIEGWVWWRYAAPDDALVPVARDWTALAEPWVSVRDGSLATHLVEAARRMFAALAPADERGGPALP